VEHVLLLAVAGLVGLFLLLYLSGGTGGRKFPARRFGSGALSVLCVAVILEITIFRRTEAGDGRIHADLQFGTLLGSYPAAQQLVCTVLNVFLFVPLGLAGAVQRSRERTGYAVCMITLTGFVFSFLIESGQLIFGKGYFEIVDIICNTAGCAAGAVLYRMLRHLFMHLRGEWGNGEGKEKDRVERSDRHSA
jgi:VanZ family protein